MLKCDPNLIIIRTDGGICSQIAFFSLGLELEKKGYTVKYDISWFRQNGKDCDGRFLRNYDLPLAFPNLTISVASEEECHIYQRLLGVDGAVHRNFHPPLYIGGYPERNTAFWNNRDFLRKNFVPVGLYENEELLNEIKQTNSCAVHVRRGDLAKYNPAYGNPPDEKYYLKAIKIVSALQKDAMFYFFSEEPEWIKENIVPQLSGIKYKIGTQNDSSKGYLDLFLMAHCKHIIASHGSFGFFAKLLSAYDEGYYISFGSDSYNTEKILSEFPNAIILCQKRGISFASSTCSSLKIRMKKVIKYFCGKLYRCTFLLR